jgi:hypothetical protein
MTMTADCFAALRVQQPDALNCLRELLQQQSRMRRCVLCGSAFTKGPSPHPARDGSDAAHAAQARPPPSACPGLHPQRPRQALRGGMHSGRRRSSLRKPGCAVSAPSCAAALAGSWNRLMNLKVAAVTVVLAQRVCRAAARPEGAPQQRLGHLSRSRVPITQRGSAAAAAHARCAQRCGARASIVSTFASSAACSVARTGVTE